MLSTYPPTPCGIATFTAALSSGLIANGDNVNVVRVTPLNDVEEPLVQGSLTDPMGSPGIGIEVLNRSDVAIIQHEYGIYAGPDGDQLLSVMDALTVPTIVVAHTVLRAPTPHQAAVLIDVCAAADAVVVMTGAARVGLTEWFGVDPSKVSVIPHGAATPPGRPRNSTTGTSARVLTWGLLGPGKGIEWAIDAIGLLADLRPCVEYTIAGATHPKVKASQGESYRRMLVQRASQVGVSEQLVFDDRYRDLQELTELIMSADLVVLPYDSPDQVTSGVLVDAVAAGKPVVSTAFPHATELLESGAGLVVPQKDSVALANAIRSVLTNPSLSSSMAAEARRLAPSLSWNAVARDFDELVDALMTHETVSR